MPGTVLEIDQHIDRLVKGVPYTPHADGYWLSDDAFDGLMQQLEDLQYRLDSMPKTNVNRTPRQNLSASMGQSTEDSDRPTEPMANSSVGDNHNPQARYQAETVGKSELSIGSDLETRAAERLDLDSHVGFPGGGE